MKIKVFLSVVLLIFISIGGFAQESTMPELESKELKMRVMEKSKNTTSIVSDFEQYKHLDFLSNDIKSSGKLVFKSPNFIKWQYQSPFNYIAIFNNDKLYINDDGKKSDVDLASSKAFKSLNNLIVKSVKGDMFDEGKFKITYFKHPKYYRVIFAPFDKTMQKLIHEIELKFDISTLDVIEVRMKESSEDYTLLKFLNQKLNVSVPDSEFSN